MGERESLASDSEIRMMASSWRTVMGIEDRALAEISAEWICRRMETKCEESFSAASAERRGAHRLFPQVRDVGRNYGEWKLDRTGGLRSYDLQ